MAWWRRASLFAPSLLAAWIVTEASGHPNENASVLKVAGPLLVMVYTLMIGLVSRRVRDAEPGQRLQQLDVLTATGRSTMWGSALAIGLGQATGFASLSVLGVLGFTATYGAVIWTISMCGPRVWRDAKIARQILPESCTEGDPLREDIRVSGLVVPAGTRWFAAGRATPHGLVTRYAVGSEASRAEVVLESDLGEISRGEFRAPPLTMWFGDVLGLTRTPLVSWGADCAFTVLPKPATVDGARDLLGLGGDAMTAVQTIRMPTEGTFRIREYTPGDDTRRIHWVRSLQAGELVVRLPDEIPPAEPAVRLVLDNHMHGTEWLSCRAHHQLLDAMVRTWLGIGKALADGGTRVTLVTAAQLSHERGMGKVERAMAPRAPREALGLGARVTWQSSVTAAALLLPPERCAMKQIVVATRPPRETPPDGVSYVVLPEGAWTTAEPLPIATHFATLPYPIGSGDNRFERRRVERAQVDAMWLDRIAFQEMTSWLGVDKRGAFVAMRDGNRVRLQGLS
nr:DUF58 domain-containing protein [Kofleriaceae bacterium]